MLTKTLAERSRLVKNSIKIVAIGGGGFTHDSHPELDMFCLDHSVANPRIGFVGAASGDNPKKIDRFYRHFNTHSTQLGHLPLGTSGQGVATWLKDRDLVYFGGGNTACMIDHFTKKGWSAPLKHAALQGVTMAGVSAGAVFWFDWCLSDSLGNGLQPLRGLGLLKGGICPHYSSEPARQIALKEAVLTHQMPLSYAIDDGAAIAFGSETVIGLKTIPPGISCYHLSVTPDGIAQKTEMRIGQRHLGLGP
jgi:dipeptidase E